MKIEFLFYWDNISLIGYQSECLLLQKGTAGVQAEGQVLFF